MLGEDLELKHVGIGPFASVQLAPTAVSARPHRGQRVNALRVRGEAHPLHAPSSCTGSLSIARCSIKGRPRAECCAFSSQPFHRAIMKQILSLAAGRGRIGQTELRQKARTGAVACQDSTAVQVWTANQLAWGLPCGPTGSTMDNGKMGRSTGWGVRRGVRARAIPEGLRMVCARATVFTRTALPTSSVRCS